jgi:uncharacterized membrane protein YraQ (UPF0718 family)
MSKDKILNVVFVFSFFIFLVISYAVDFSPGINIGGNFLDFVKSMLAILPIAFILIGLFEVWVERKTVEKYFGDASGFRGYIWAIILSSTTVGGAYVAFPVAHTLYKKGAKLSIILTYIGSSALTRIPMTIFEATFLGLKFSVIRLLVSIPLVIFSSILIGRFFKNKIRD